MITYKVDKELLTAVNNDLRNKLRELSEISEAFKAVQGDLEEHQAAIESPSISAARAELQNLVSQTDALYAAILVRMQKLANVSDQTAKHISALEEHSEAALQRGAPANGDTDSESI